MVDFYRTNPGSGFTLKWNGYTALFLSAPPTFIWAGIFEDRGVGWNVYLST